MRLSDFLFKSRYQSGRWLRFTEAYPVLPTIIALTGLIAIAYSLAQIVGASQTFGHGQLVETLNAVSNSKPLMEKAIDLRTAYHQYFSPEIRYLFFHLYGNIALYLVVPFLLLLELLYPVNPSQPLIGKGLLQDAVWYVVATPLTILILFPVIEFLHGLFVNYLGFLVIENAANWQAWIQITAALLITEFFIWFTHFYRHKIHALWFFHAVHHSQKELNIFTEDRAHIVDQLFGTLFAFIPFFIFQVSDPFTLAIIYIFKPIHTRFIHANLKINFGWLGWIFTSPQFHRVHHSMDPLHRDKNFGVHFALFDHLFRTAYNNRNEYPVTGIEDVQFPNEDKVRTRKLLGNWFFQMGYPFVQLTEKMIVFSRLKFLRARAFLRNLRNNSKSVS